MKLQPNRERRFKGTGANSWAMANRDYARACKKTDRQKHKTELKKDIDKETQRAD